MKPGSSVGIRNTIVSSLFTSLLADWIANRREPIPESLVLVTTRGLARTTAVENAEVSPGAGLVDDTGVVVTLATAVIVAPAGKVVVAVKVRFTVWLDVGAAT